MCACALWMAGFQPTVCQDAAVPFRPHRSRAPPAHDSSRQVPRLTPAQRNTTYRHTDGIVSSTRWAFIGAHPPHRCTSCCASGDVTKEHLAASSARSARNRALYIRVPRHVARSTQACRSRPRVQVKTAGSGGVARRLAAPAAAAWQRFAWAEVKLSLAYALRSPSKWTRQAEVDSTGCGERSQSNEALDCKMDYSGCSNRTACRTGCRGTGATGSKSGGRADDRSARL